MLQDKHFTAIVLAAGKGSRMHSDTPKQYMLLCGKEVLYYSLKEFQESPVDDIILVTREEDISYCEKDLVERYHFDKVSKVIAGGDERYWSVQHGLEKAEGTDYVLIHDGARPCINQDMILRSMQEVILCGACTVGVPAKDTIKIVDDEHYGIDTPDRNSLWQVQTPQSFLYKDIVDAYDKMRRNREGTITDDTMIVERYLGKRSKLILGDYCNLKITTPEDILMAEIFLQKS